MKRKLVQLRKFVLYIRKCTVSPTSGTSHLRWLDVTNNAMRGGGGGDGGGGDGYGKGVHYNG